MKDFEQSLKNIKEAKKVSLGYKIEAVQQLILLRYQALTTISSIAFAVVGIAISIRSDIIHNWILAIISFIFLVLVALIALGRYLYLLRDDIKSISKMIEDLPQEDWDKPIENQTFKADWWPETLYTSLIFGFILFGLSFIK